MAAHQLFWSGKPILNPRSCNTKWMFKSPTIIKGKKKNTTYSKHFNGIVAYITSEYIVTLAWLAPACQHCYCYGL